MHRRGARHHPVHVEDDGSIVDRSMCERALVPVTSSPLPEPADPSARQSRAPSGRQDTGVVPWAPAAPAHDRDVMHGYLPQALVPAHSQHRCEDRCRSSGKSWKKNGVDRRSRRRHDVRRPAAQAARTRAAGTRALDGARRHDAHHAQLRLTDRRSPPRFSGPPGDTRRIPLACAQSDGGREDLRGRGEGAAGRLARPPGRRWRCRPRRPLPHDRPSGPGGTGKPDDGGQRLHAREVRRKTSGIPGLRALAPSRSAASTPCQRTPPDVAGIHAAAR